MSQNKYLGKGIYSVAEAARYTGLNPKRVLSWLAIKGTPSLLHTDYEELGIHGALSFLNLFEVYVVGQFRDKDVSLQEIRKAHSILQKDLQTVHPFCHKDLYSHSKKVFAKIASDESNSALYQVVSGQYFDEELMKEHLHRVDYNKITKLAERWHIARGVVIDPKICLGKPVLEGSGISAHIVASEYWANEKNIRLVADLYQITQEEVSNAVIFQESHGYGKAA